MLKRVSVPVRDTSPAAVPAPGWKEHQVNTLWVLLSQSVHPSSSLSCSFPVGSLDPQHPPHPLVWFSPSDLWVRPCSVFCAQALSELLEMIPLKGIVPPAPPRAPLDTGCGP